MMRFVHSVRFRLTCWHSAILASVLVSFGVVLYGTVSYQILHHHDDALKEVSRSVVSILGRQPDCATLTADQIHDLGRLERLVLVHDLAGKGQVFYRSPDLDPSLTPRDETQFRELLSQRESFQTVQTSHGDLRIYSVRYTTSAGRLGVVRVMESLGNVHEALATLRWALFAMVPFSLLIAGIGGYWIAGRALRPVDEVARLAREIEATNLSRRLPAPKSDDELGSLVDTFNQMIGRLEGAFESMRRFTADASHELKTPLTIMRTAIEVDLGRDRTAEEHRRTLRSLLQEVEGMSRIVGNLLFLARVDAGSLGIERKRVCLDEIAGEVVEAMRPVAEAHGVELSLRRSEPVPVLGDERWLRQMLCNLVDNGILHGGSKGKVEISLEGRDGWAVLSVQDSGPGISKEDRTRIFERFYRADNARACEGGGAGLGLPIAVWVAQSHGGSLTVDSEVGRGSVFRVALPIGPRRAAES